MWKLFSVVKTDRGASFASLGEFSTKREAVSKMDSLRKPKSAIVRIGRSYYFETAQ
jgi:hypothetical protein